MDALDACSECGHEPVEGLCPGCGVTWWPEKAVSVVNHIVRHPADVEKMIRFWRGSQWHVASARDNDIMAAVRAVARGG